MGNKWSGRPASIAERFWRYVRKTDGCWEWTGATQFPGYGKLGLGDGARVGYAHRISWELHYGSIPEGMEVLHRCDNPPCSRPDHLFLGSQADNLADMRAKGRAYRPPNRWAKRRPQQEVSA